MKIISDLPDDLCMRIGQIVTLWSYIEWEAHEIMYLALGVNPKIARFSVAEPRPADQLERVKKILSLYDVEFDRDRLKTLITRAKMLKDRRDAFAHGVWLHDAEKNMLGLRRTTGVDPTTNLPNKAWPSREPWGPVHMRYLVAAFRNYASEINSYRAHLIGVLGPTPELPRRPYSNRQAQDTQLLKEPESPPE